MERPEKATSEFVLILSTTQSVGARRRLADFVIGGLLVVFAIGGFAM
jgi:hypothetical protein